MPRQDSIALRLQTPPRSAGKSLPADLPQSFDCPSDRQTSRCRIAQPCALVLCPHQLQGQRETVHTHPACAVPPSSRPPTPLAGRVADARWAAPDSVFPASANRTPPVLCTASAAPATHARASPRSWLQLSLERMPISESTTPSFLIYHHLDYNDCHLSVHFYPVHH